MKTFSITLLMLSILFSAFSILAPDVNAVSTRVFVDPSYISEPIASTFTVAIKLADVENLFGFDVRFSWDSTILQYVSHIAKCPVETYPDGVLHEPVLWIRDVVEEDEGTLWYWIAVASLGGDVPSFYGSGTMFEITFEVADEGFSELEIFHCDLASKEAQPIPHEIENGYFETAIGPTFEFTYEDPCRNTALKISTDDKYFQFIAPDKTFPAKQDPNMIIYKCIIIIHFEDEELKLTTLAIDTKLDFCIAFAEDKQTGERYFLLDKPDWRGWQTTNYNECMVR